MNTTTYTTHLNNQPLNTDWHSKSTNRDMKTTKQNSFKKPGRNWEQWVQMVLIIGSCFLIIILMSKAIESGKGLGLVGKEVRKLKPS